jgi:hypothetical protein
VQGDERIICIRDGRKEILLLDESEMRNIMVKGMREIDWEGGWPPWQ